jgi:murein L,D-transpeptidase YafK
MMSISVVIRFAFICLSIVLLSACRGDVAPHTKQLPAEAQALLAKKGMRQEAPIFVRIFKEESELEIWKRMDDGRYEHFKTYPICAWSGTLGPKLKQGDKQAPEGFYTVTPGLMNPNSQFHLAFNLGFPNAFDKANGRTGSALMVHGKCTSAGCFAMTDALIEEIYILAREAFQGGQTAFHVHAFPFRMTEENMKRHAKSEWYGFWRQLKAGYDAFEFFRVPPKVAICSRQYLVNVNFLGHTATPDPQGPCPAYEPALPDVIPGFENMPDAQIAARQRPPARIAVTDTSSPADVPVSASLTPVAVEPAQTGAVIPAAQQAGPVRMPEAVASRPADAETARDPAGSAAAAAEAVPAQSHETEPGGTQRTRRSGKGDMLTVSPPAPVSMAPVSPANVNLGYAPSPAAVPRVN